jgi:hypothetical protein
VFSINATRRFKVGCAIALKQINAFLAKADINTAQYTQAFEDRSNSYKNWRKTLQDLETPSEDGVITVPYLTSRLRATLPQDTTYALEAVTNAVTLIHHLNLSEVCIIR